MSEPTIVPVEQAIVATLLYFQQWHLPLTPWDILRFLPNALADSSPRTLKAPLDTLIDRKQILIEQGLYYIPGDPRVLQERSARYNASLTKWKIVHDAVGHIRWIPFLRMVAVTNTLTMWAAEEESDIDILIIGAAGRLWTVRMLVTATLQLFALRRHGRVIRNRICLSFYLSDRALDLRKFFSEPHDRHYAYWVSTIVPLFQTKDSRMEEQFQTANTWVRDYFPQHWWVDLIDRYRVRDSRFIVSIRRGLEYILGGSLGKWVESLLRSFQRRKIFAHSNTRAHDPTSVDVVVNDDVFKFHESDSRAYSRKQWKEELAAHGIPADF